MSRGDRLVTSRFAGDVAGQLAELERHYGISAAELIRRGIGALYGAYLVERFSVKEKSTPGTARGYRKPKDQAA